MERDGRTTGELLRAVMERRGMTIQEVAEWSGMEPVVIEWLLLNQVPMSTEIAYRLSMATGISMSVWTANR